MRWSRTFWGNDAGDLRIGARARYMPIPGTDIEFIDQFTLRRESDGGIAWDALEGTGNVLGFSGLLLRFLARCRQQ